MKNKILIILLIFLSSCGYSSIYEGNQSRDFKLSIIKTNGDSEFNNLIKKELKLFSNNSSKKEYFLSINTNYKKTITSKNLAGVANTYNISLSASILVEINNKINNFQFKENINISNNTNSFEQNNYEKNIRRNFASSIREKLIIKILNINDS